MSRSTPAPPTVLAVLFFLALPLSPTPAAPGPERGEDGGRALSGARWTGKYENSRGESGEEKLELQEEKGGRLKGLWTDAGAFRCELKGERLGRDALWLEGMTAAGVQYRVIGRLEGDELVLHFTARDVNRGVRWFGVERCRRDQK
jgi:hypothetical protein